MNGICAAARPSSKWRSNTHTRNEKCVGLCPCAASLEFILLFIEISKQGKEKQLILPKEKRTHIAYSLHESLRWFYCA